MSNLATTDIVIVGGSAFTVAGTLEIEDVKRNYGSEIPGLASMQATVVDNEETNARTITFTAATGSKG